MLLVGEGGPRETSTDNGPPVSREMNDNSNDDDDDPLLGSDRNPLSINNDQDDEDENPISDSDDDEGMDHIVYMDRLLLVLTSLFHAI